MNREEEAIRYIKDNVCYGQEECFDGICKSTEDNPCAIEIAIEALAKQIPKKPVLEKTKGIVGIDMWHCPACDEEIISDWNRDIANPYCHLCGQRLDWSKPKGDSYDFAIIDEVIAYDTQKKD